MSAISQITDRVKELRQAFDQSRAVPRRSGSSEQTADLLAIRVARDAYAIRVNEISGLATDRKIVALPSPVPELLGIAGIRGVIVPVYSLSGLLGYAVETEAIHWLAVCGTHEPIALAFADFEGYVRVPTSQLYATERQDIARTYIKHVVRTKEATRAVVSIPLVQGAIQKRGAGTISKEH